MKKNIIKNQLKMIVIFLAGFTCLSGISAAPQAVKSADLIASGIRIRKVDISTMDFYTSVSIHNKYSAQFSKIAKGTVNIREVMGNPVNNVKPAFWIVSDNKELEIVLKDGIKENSAGIRKQSSESGVYKNHGNIVMRIDPSVPFEWISRMIFMEYARYLMNSIAPAASAYNIGWFYSGMSAYIGWKAQATAEERSDSDFQNDIRGYYSGFFNSREPLSLKQIENPEDWKKSVSENPVQAFAQSVLIYQYLVMKAGDDAGLNILKLYNSESYFEQAFSRVYKSDLTEFENELREKLYPEVKRTGVKTAQ
jgi:hypothetical protein